MVARSEIHRIVGSLDAFSGISGGLRDDEDLFERGLDSFGSVQLMLALEERFQVEFPDHLLNRRVFSTIHSIHDAVATLTVGVEA